MHRIKKLSDNMKDEICSAKHYAECYLMYKAKGDTPWANRYKEMANDELKHATYLHDEVSGEIETLSRVYTPPEEMQEKWEDSHKHFVEKVAWIKQMLQM